MPPLSFSNEATVSAASTLKVAPLVLVIEPALPLIVAGR